MRVVKPSRHGASGSPKRQRPTAAAARRFFAVLAGTVLFVNITAIGCSLVVPSDFVGNTRNGNAGNGNGGNAGSGGSIDSGGNAGSGGSVDSGGSAGSGVAGNAGSIDSGGSAGGSNAGNAGGSDSGGSAGNGNGNAGNAGTSASTTCIPACVDNHVCISKVCSCPQGQVDCSGVCIEVPLGKGACDVCGNICRADQICANGACACPTGKAECGTACADLTSDPRNCRACNISCLFGQSCMDGVCKTTPCDGLCTNPEPLTVQADGFRIETVDPGAHCITVVGYIPTKTNPRIVCWNFESSRTLQVNGQVTPCTPNNGAPLVQQPLGWYCIQVGEGNNGGFVLPNQ